GLEALLDEPIRAEHDRGVEPPVHRERQGFPTRLRPAPPTASPDEYNPASSRHARAQKAQHPWPLPVDGRPCASEDRSDRSPREWRERPPQRQHPVRRQNSRPSDGDRDPSSGPIAKPPAPTPLPAPTHAPSSGFSPH